MNQRVAKEIRKLCDYKPYAKRQYFRRNPPKLNRYDVGTLMVDRRRCLYKLAKLAYRKTKDMAQVVAVIMECRRREQGHVAAPA